MKANNSLKKAVAVLTCAAVLMAAGASTMALTEKADNTIKIAAMSDTHYLPPDMIKDTADYKTHLTATGKCSPKAAQSLIKCSIQSGRSSRTSC